MLLRKFSQTFKVSLALLFAVLSTGILPTATAYATHPGSHPPAPPAPVMVFVCKYVGSPGVNERLQTGDNPISVSIHAVGGATVGSYFNDQQGRSFVLMVDNTDPGPSDDPAITACPLPASTLITTPAVLQQVVCGPNNDIYSVVANTNYTVVNNGDGTFTLTASAGYIFSTTGTGTVTLTVPLDTNTVCPDSGSVTLCHATGSETNPFVRITVSAAGAFNGHLGNDHQDGEDIIPPFTYQGQTYSQNWDATGQATFASQNCAAPGPLTPAAAEFLNPTCENPMGRVVIPATTGVTYKINGVVKAAGTYSYPASTTVTVTAEAQEGFTLQTGATATWSHTFTAVPTNCILGTNDVCPNIEGTQTVVPAGLIQNPTTGECFIPGGRGAFTPAQVLGATTSTQALPETLPSTGGADSPLAIIIASLLAYGAAYFLQGRRLIARKEALSA